MVELSLEAFRRNRVIIVSSKEMRNVFARSQAIISRTHAIAYRDGTLAELNRQGGISSLKIRD